MKSTRPHFFLAGTSCTMLGVALLLALGGYFRAVEHSGSAVSSEKRLLSQLKVFHEQLKIAETPDQAKAALKAAENVTGLGSESEGGRELRKAYSPILAVFASKPREADSHFTLSKKRELMESLVNVYRKEVPNGDLRVRAGYLNILFDTQSSLLNESDESEQVYIRRNRERFDGLKSLTGIGDSAVRARIANVDSIFQIYERGFQQGMKWRAEKIESLAKLEKALPLIAKNIYSGEDSSVDDTRRSFLYVCFFSLLIAVASFVSLYLGFKVLRMRSELKWESFLTYLRGFASENVDPQVKSALDSLQEDREWAIALAEAQRAEENFLRSCQNLLAVPRSIQTPFFVAGKDKTIRHWNEAAGILFGLSESKEWGLQDVIRPELINSREGEVEKSLELIRASFSSMTEDRFEILLRQNGDWRPYELSISPITAGPLAGGKVLLWREIRSEADRIDRGITVQIQRVRDIILKLTQDKGAVLSVQETDSPAVQSMIQDLSSLKRRLDEREFLWKSEVQGLLDQVSRQQEILHRLSEELGSIRSGQAEALGLVRQVYNGEEHLHDELCVMERDLERWTMNRKRLVGDLQQQSSVLGRARRFEEQLRLATAEMLGELEVYYKGLAELREFADTARIHSVNLSLVKDPEYWEYASRSRAFAHELNRFSSLAENLGQKIKAFLTAHPGGALAAHLSGPDLDENALASISEEQEKIAQLLKRWKENGANLLNEGERALTILQDTEQAGAVVSQLGETSLLINQQTKGNLERWN